MLSEGPMQNLERYLEGRVAIITGGFSGIGRSISEALADRGAAVALGGRTVRNDAADAFQSKGASVFCGHLDVRDVGSVQQFVNSVRSVLGPIDILVNSAGIGISQAVCDHPEDAWNDVLDTNLSGPFRMTRACLPGMIERQWGRIIHIGSTAARTAVADHPAYCASKSGLLGLSRAVSLEGAPHGVTSIVLSPTWVETEMLRTSFHRQATAKGSTMEQEIDQMVANSPQQRLVQPEEIAALAAFLCRDEARGITMEDIQINAGSLW